MPSCCLPYCTPPGVLLCGHVGAPQRGIAHANCACELRESQGITRRGITANCAGDQAGIKGTHPDSPAFHYNSLTRFAFAIQVVRVIRFA